MCAYAVELIILMSACAVCAFYHRAFLGIGSVVATSLAPIEKRASALALLFTGLLLAKDVAALLGTSFGQYSQWRSTFLLIVAIGVVVLARLVSTLPSRNDDARGDIRMQRRALKDVDTWLSLCVTLLLSGSMFALLTYINPIFAQVTGLSPQGVNGSLLLIGAGSIIGNVLGGKWTDRNLLATLSTALVILVAASMVFTWASAESLFLAQVTLFLWAMTALACLPGFQFNILKKYGASSHLLSTLNIGAFHAGGALVTWTGNIVISSGLGLSSMPLAVSR